MTNHSQVSQTTPRAARVNRGAPTALTWKDIEQRQGAIPVKAWSLNVLPLVAMVASVAAVVVYYVDVVAR